MKLLNGQEWLLDTAFNGDCLDFMKLMPDKCIDLVLTDPPYGIGEDGGKQRRAKSKHIKKDWDSIRPRKEVFQEIFRISKHQIIWGGNYFSDYLPPSSGWIFWDKKLQNSDFSDGELAFTSFNKGLKMFSHSKNGGNINLFKYTHIHPTQKPLKLFKWCLEKYAPENALIFDPFLGSFTTAVACHHYGLNWIGCEKEEDYFKAGSDRYERECQQIFMEF